MKILLSISVILLLACNGFSQTVETELQSRKPGIIPPDKVIRICAPSRADLLNKKQPLFIVFSKKIKATFSDTSFSHIKPNYIKSINILKGNNATQKYGIAAEHGVIEITIKENNHRDFMKVYRNIIKS